MKPVEIQYFDVHCQPFSTDTQNRVIFLCGRDEILNISTEVAEVTDNSIFTPVRRQAETALTYQRALWRHTSTINQQLHSRAATMRRSPSIALMLRVRVTPTHR